MSNPTTPFGWQMPTNTDLVTDLPADFEVFGQAVATSLADLNGGTTGQTLTKATNTDMDFTWATPAAGGGMTLLTTHSLSGSTSTISGISGSYKSLFGIISGGTTTATVGTNWKINPNGSTTITSVATTEAGASYDYTSTWYLNISNIKPTEGNNAWSFTIDNYASTTSHKPLKMSGQFKYYDNTLGSTNAGGGIRTTSAITSLDFVTLSGSFNGGTVLLYGVN